MQTTRRQFIQSSLGCAIAMSLDSLTTRGAETKVKIPIGFQLYTVRGEFSRDVPGTLKTLSALGYKGVEFWGYAGTPEVYQKYSASDLRKLLDANGLTCCGMHVELKAISPENLSRTLDNSKILGGEFVNVASAKDKMGSEKGIGELAKMLTAAAAQAKSQNITIGYHAHGFDFEKLNGRPAWEILFGQLGPEINMQIDVGNSLGGGGDPLGMLRKFPGRTRTIHIKEYEDKTFDSDYYKQIFQLCETVSGTKWYIVEMGGSSGNGFDIPRQALEKLHRVGK